MTISQQILACPPDWDAYKIADHVGTTYGYVHNVWSRYRSSEAVQQRPRGWRRLSGDQVRAIRGDFRPLKVIAAQYEIGLTTAHRIRAYESRMDVV